MKIKIPTLDLIEAFLKTMDVYTVFPDTCISVSYGLKQFDEQNLTSNITIEIDDKIFCENIKLYKLWEVIGLKVQNESAGSQLSNVKSFC